MLCDARHVRLRRLFDVRWWRLYNVRLRRLCDVRPTGGNRGGAACAFVPLRQLSCGLRSGIHLVRLLWNVRRLLSLHRVLGMRNMPGRRLLGVRRVLDLRRMLGVCRRVLDVWRVLDVCRRNLRRGDGGRFGLCQLCPGGPGPCSPSRPEPAVDLFQSFVDAAHPGADAGTERYAAAVDLP